MSRFNTGNPIGSNDPRDRDDNTKNLDELVNSKTKTNVPDRLGVPRKTWHGIESEFSADQLAREQQYQQVILGYGNEPLGDYAAGIEVTGYNQTIRDCAGGTCVFYRAAVGTELPYTTTGLGMPEGGAFVDVGDAVLRQDLANPDKGAAMVGFQQSGYGASQRTSQDKMRDVVSIKDFGAVGDGATNDQASIEKTVEAALQQGASVYWPPGEYLSDASIPNFHAVSHTGSGVILRGADVFHITPSGNQTNIMYVKAGGVSGSDGLSEAQPVTMAKACDVLGKIGEKAAAGIWRIQIIGAISFNGVRIRNWPSFANRVEVWGEAADFNSVPTAVWDGTTATESYAFRAEYTFGTLYFHFKNIKFTNWNKSANAGGIVIWGPNVTLTENCHSDNCAIGFWYRQGYVRHIYGVVANAQSYGVSVQYSGTGNIGNLIGGGVHFINCAQGVNAGRNSTVYIQGSTFDNMTHYCIEVTRVSRIRTQANNFNSFGIAGIWINLNSAYTPDNQSGNPDTFGPLSESKPAVMRDSGGVHLSVDRGSQRSLHNYSQGQLVEIQGTLTQTLLSSGGRDDFAPFRLPAYFLYSPSFKLEVEVGLSLAAGASGELALHSAGPSGLSKLAAINVAPAGSGSAGVVRLTFYNSPGLSNARYSYEYKARDLVQEGIASSGLDHSTIRSNLDQILIFRLYWTPASVEKATFSNMRTYVEG